MPGRIFKNIQRLFLSTFVAAIAVSGVLLFMSDAARAINYGEGAYSAENCVYNTCTSSNDPGSGSSSGGNSSSSGASSSGGTTVAQTKSGLDVGINLENGQTITEDEYIITVTPLNGQGKSFQKVEIYLDGILVHTGTPDSTGTLTWPWNVRDNPARKVKIIIFDENGDTITKEFTLNIDLASQKSSGSPVPERDITAESNAADTASGQDNGFPWLWLLFGFLFLLIFLLLIWLLFKRRRRDDDDQNNQTTQFYQ